jgi:hypothetical protein
MTKADDAIQRHIDMVTGFISTMQTRRNDLVKKMFELQKLDGEFEKLLQVTLLKLLATHEIGLSSSKSDRDTPPKLKDSNTYQ